MKKLSFLLLAVSLAACGGGSTPGTGPAPVEPGVIRMNFSRVEHTATLLGNGKVLIVGGFDGNGDIVGTPEIYDPSLNRFLTVENGVVNVGSHTATLLNNDNVLIIDNVAAYLYNPSDNTFTATGSPNLPRTGHTSTLLEDGNVLVAGGDNVPSQQAEIDGVEFGTFSLTGTTILPRSGHTANRLPDGKVLILGGSAFSTNGETFDPTAGSFISSPNPEQYLAYHATSVLPDNTILITGSWSPATASFTNIPQVYDPALPLDPFAFTGNMIGVRANHTATALPGGNVLVAGGENASEFLRTAEIFDKVSRAFASTGDMAVARRYHTATLLPNGKVLIAGGENGSGVHDTAEIYDPASGAFSADY